MGNVLAREENPHRGLVGRPGSWRTVVAMKGHSVVIAGGGPTGLMLAAELALARVDVAIVERRTSQAVAGTRAGGLHSRTLEVLDQRGVAGRFLSRGRAMQVAGFAMTRTRPASTPGTTERGSSRCSAPSPRRRPC